MATRKTLPKPEPVVTTTVCSICGLAWEDHSESPDVLECVELLKARATKPQPVTYPVYPTYPYWWTTKERHGHEETWKGPWKWESTGAVGMLETKTG